MTAEQSQDLNVDEEEELQQQEPLSPDDQEDADYARFLAESEEEEASAGEGEPDESPEGQGGDEDESQEPAAKDEQEQQPKAEKPIDKPFEPFPGFDALPDEAKHHIRQMHNNYNAQQHQLVPVQRKNQQLQQQLRDLQAEREALRKQVPDEAKQNWEKYQEDFPDEAEVLGQRFQRLESELQSTRAEAAEARELVRLTQIDPNWATKHRSEEFKAWAQHMTPEERQLYQARDAESAAELLRRFDADVAAVKQQLEQQAQPAPEQPKPAKPSARQAVAPSQRPRQSTSLARANPDWDDEDHAFAQFLIESGEQP